MAEFGERAVLLERIPPMTCFTRPKFRACRRAAVTLTVALALLFANGVGPAAASEDGRAERLYSKALGELHGGRPEAAASLLDEAVRLNPNDARAHYYRGVTLGRLGRWEEAVEELRLAASQDGALARTELELGWALMSAERYDEVAAVLARTKENPSTAARAYLFDGINELRRGNFQDAALRLTRAITIDPTQVLPARYYRGIALLEAKDLVAAEEDFAYVARTAPSSAMGIEAKAFVEEIRGTFVPSYRLHAGIAFEYDSNVALAPDDDTIAKDILGISQEDDSRTVLTAGGSYAVHASETWHVSVAYDFLQSLHAELNEFNLQSHRLATQVAHFRGPLTMGLTGAWEYSFLDSESFLSEGSLMPWLRLAEGDFGHAEAYYRLRNRDFILQPFATQRDSFNHTAGARQFFYLGAPERFVAVGYRWDRDVADNAAGRRFNFDGHQFELGLGWRFPGEITADAIYAYKIEDYDHPTALGRDDEQHIAVLRAEKRLARLVWATASYIARLNQSDRPAFEYDRHIGSLGLEVRY